MFRMVIKGYKYFIVNKNYAVISKNNSKIISVVHWSFVNLCAANIYYSL